MKPLLVSTREVEILEVFVEAQSMGDPRRAIRHELWGGHLFCLSTADADSKQGRADIKRGRRALAKKIPYESLINDTKRRGSYVPEVTVSVAREMRESGLSAREISQKTGLSRESVGLYAPLTRGAAMKLVWARRREVKVELKPRKAFTLRLTKGELEQLVALRLPDEPTSTCIRRLALEQINEEG